MTKMYTNSKGVSYYKQCGKYFKNSGWLEVEIFENEYIEETNKIKEKSKNGKLTKETKIWRLQNAEHKRMIKEIEKSKAKFVKADFSSNDFLEFLEVLVKIVNNVDSNLKNEKI